MSFKISACVVAATLGVMLIGCEQPKKKEQIGSNLNQKFVMELSDVPKQAIVEVLKIQPDFQLAGAEKELKHGDIYIDLEGTKEDGNEVEFDLLFRDGQWQVMEVQRDLTLEQCPAEVVAALEADLPGFNAKRIIESDQRTGVVIYEFYVGQTDSSVVRKEVKFENNQAELLDKEWRH